MYKKLITSVLLALSCNVHAEKIHMEVFHTADQHVINMNMAKDYAAVTVYDMSAPEKLEDQLSKNLPSDPKLAQAEAEKRIKAGGNELNYKLITAYEGSMKASSYNLTKLPAIVFNDGQSILYGTTDLLLAIKQYRKYMASKGQ